MIFVFRQKLGPRDLLPSNGSHGRGNKIVIEGDSGSGKSMLCSWLAYTWATQENFFRHSFQHVIYLNMATLTGNLETAVYKSLFSDNFKISINEFWKMLEKKSEKVLLVIDEYDFDRSIDLGDILNGTRLKGCTVLLTARPGTIPQNSFVPDTKWFNLGFSDANIKRCFRTCVSLCDLDNDEFEKLHHLAGRDAWTLRPHLANPMLATMAFAVYNVLRKGTMLREMKTPCDLLQKYGVAMATLYCRKQRIDVIGTEFPDDVISAIDQLDSFAFECMMGNRKSFTSTEVLEETGSDIVLQFGAFTNYPSSQRLKFSCGISMDFLAARHIADMPFEELESTVMRNKMVKLPKYSQVSTF